MVDRIGGWHRTPVTVPRCFNASHIQRMNPALLAKAVGWNPNTLAVGLVCGSLTLFIPELTDHCTRLQGTAFCKKCKTDTTTLAGISAMSGFDIVTGNDDRRLKGLEQFDTGDCASCKAYGQPCGADYEHTKKVFRASTNLFCVGEEGPVIFIDNGLHFAYSADRSDTYFFGEFDSTLIHIHAVWSKPMPHTQERGYAATSLCRLKSVSTNWHVRASTNGSLLMRVRSNNLVILAFFWTG